MFNKIAFIGAGSMSEAMISGIINKNVLKSEQIYVTNKNNQERLNRLHERYHIKCEENKQIVVDQADIVILSMKPYDLKEAVLGLKSLIQPNQLIISVVAGVSTDYISQLLGMDNPIIRAMPNTSASIGYAATAISKGKYANDQHVDMAKQLFNTIGITVLIEEDDMHIVTAISGSGPAYFYYMVEALEKAAIESGLDPSIAKTLITQTIIGAGEMLRQSGESADILRKKVTSPAGTTEAGIKALMKHNFEDAIIECVKSAHNRSLELGKQNN